MTGRERVASVTSPDGRLDVSLELEDRGEAAGYGAHEADCPVYSVDAGDRTVVEPSRLGLEFDGAPPLTHNVEVVETDREAVDRTWSPPYGERATVRDRYRELRVLLGETVPPERRFRVVVRAYEAGVALRYELPEATDAGREAGRVAVSGERTEFRFPEGCEAYDHRGESPYTLRPVGEAGTTDDGWGLDSERPLTVEYPGGGHAAVTEAGNEDFARTLLRGTGEGAITTVLDGVVRGRAPFRTPWRAVVVGETPGDLLERNDLVRNLAPECRLDDTGWIQPGTVIREMSLTTEGGRDCVDFAAEHGLDYVPFDGGWYGPPYDERTDAASATPWAWKVGEDAPDPDRLDVPAVVEYAEERGVGVWLYLDKRVVERRLEDLLPIYESWGVAGLKFGFVRVGDQGWTGWLHDAVRRCAEHELMVNVHDEYRPTGLSRTYPNLLTQEGVRGNEHHPAPESNATLPFTRSIAGAADCTVCYREADSRTTDAHQLALPVVVYSPLHHLYWYGEPADFEGLPEREFFATLPTTWDDTTVVEGEIGEYATIARRHGEEWFLGSVTDDARDLSVPLDFLDGEFAAAVYADETPEAPIVQGESRVRVERSTVDGSDELRADLHAGGGLAVRFRPVEDADP